MKNLSVKTVIDFVQRNFEVHGEFEGIVYRTKRNGTQEHYPYDPVSYYQRSPLVIRNEAIRRFAASVSNPRLTDYKSVIKKLKLLHAVYFSIPERRNYSVRRRLCAPAGKL